ncbi:signal peptidase I [Candidatus Gottesmanbacteria bacterium RBG_16_52_11]|uniref:Signal peptidase I n=1 Tax=Candidatus Gottesmanbacteria bacterium RBG_16_52_11 TaxID=1798374 RepID=A0A1F5YNP8_9BACT|nr:MAG: signal peptidase I [Candidatus Gottesmanbacteria bacterium RBG_16_52_11]
MRMFLRLLLHGLWGAVLALIVIGLSYYLLSRTGHVEPVSAYIILSGSMEPAVPTGSVVFAVRQPFYIKGDIITFKSPVNDKNIITHRIDSVEYTDTFYGDAAVRTRGDSNSDPDPNPVDQSRIIGKVFVTVPYLGYLGDAAKKPQGFILLVVVPATIIIWEEFKSIRQEAIKSASKALGKWKTKRNPDSLPVAAVQASSGSLRVLHMRNYMVIIPAAFALLIITGVGARAYFLDREQSTENVIIAGIWTTPTPAVTPVNTPTPTPEPQNGPAVVINEINWGGGNDQWVELKNMTTAPVDLTGWDILNLGAGGPNAIITIPSGSIPANGFFLISEFNKADSKINVDPDYITTDISLENGGEQLFLRNTTDTVIDTANGTLAWHAGSGSTPQKSMERISPPGDGTQAGQWQSATTHTNMDASGTNDEFGTPKAVNGL